MYVLIQYINPRFAATDICLSSYSEGRKICKKYKVAPEPAALKHYKDGAFHKDYDRKMTVTSMVNFMRDPSGDLPWEEDASAEDVVHLGNAQVGTHGSSALGQSGLYAGRGYVLECAGVWRGWCCLWSRTSVALCSIVLDSPGRARMFSAVSVVSVLQLPPAGRISMFPCEGILGLGRGAGLGAPTRV